MSYIVSVLGELELEGVQFFREALLFGQFYYLLGGHEAAFLLFHIQEFNLLVLLLQTGDLFLKTSFLVSLLHFLESDRLVEGVGEAGNLRGGVILGFYMICNGYVVSGCPSRGGSAAHSPLHTPDCSSLYIPRNDSPPFRPTHSDPPMNRKDKHTRRYGIL